MDIISEKLDNIKRSYPIISKKLDIIKRMYPIMSKGVEDVLIYMIKSTPKQVFHFTRKVPISAADENGNYGLRPIVSMSLDNDGEIIFHGLTGEEFYAEDVFGGIIAIFTMVDTMGQIKI